MDLALAASKDPVIGRDFLTWLWYKSESNSGQFISKQHGAYVLLLEQRITVEGGSGETRESAVVSGLNSEMKEARLGLSVGKKVHSAQIRIEHLEDTWSVKLKADDFSFGSLKTPKVETKKEEGEDPDAIFLEKIYLIEKCLSFIDDIFKSYLALRFSADWEREVKGIRNWLAAM